MNQQTSNPFLPSEDIETIKDKIKIPIEYKRFQDININIVRQNNFQIINKIQKNKIESKSNNENK